MSAKTLVALLRQLARHIEAEDSFEGSFEYHASTRQVGFYEVNAAYRIGNSDGAQGGMMLIQGNR
jgi:hypothetical protein